MNQSGIVTFNEMLQCQASQRDPESIPTCIYGGLLLLKHVTLSFFGTVVLVSFGSQAEIAGTPSLAHVIGLEYSKLEYNIFSCYETNFPFSLFLS